MTIRIRRLTLFSSKMLVAFICSVVSYSLQAQSNINFESILKKEPGFIVSYADSLTDIRMSDEGIKLLELALKQSAVKNNPKNLASVYQGIGDCYDDKQEYRKSLMYYAKALGYITEAKDTALLVRNYVATAGGYSELEETDTCMMYLELGRSIAEKYPKKYGRFLKTIYNNLGLAFNEKTNYTESLKYYYKSIEYTDKIKDKEGLARTYNNIGNLYADMLQYDKSLEYYKKVLQLTNSSYTLANIGILYTDIKQFDSALYYIKKSIAMDLKNNDKAGLSSSYTVVGNLYKKEKRFDSAMYFYSLSSKLANEIEDIGVIQNNEYNIVELLIEQKKYAEAKPLAIRNLESLLDGDDLSFISDAYGQLKEIYFKLGDYKSAFEYQEKYLLYKDSAQSANKTLEIRNLELNAEYKQKSVNDSLLHAQQNLLIDIQHKEQIKKQRIVLFSFIAILIIVAIFSIIVLKRYKVSQRQREIINKQKNEMFHQKQIVEEKQKEILDSIHYAKRIQYALIAHKDFLEQYLPKNFVYFNPKDIVSGDFYWATKTENYFYLAICDSTGHGVPGAFMSLLNIGFLSEAINEKGILKPNEVFNYVRERLVQSISKDGQKDGFDGILLRYDLSNGKMDYASANNSPVQISNGEIFSLPGDRMPVGVGERKEDFALYTIDAKKGDKIFFYTDGFADQFGGPKGKKYKYRKLNELLAQHVNKSISSFTEVLSEEFESWRGDLEQVDDVCVIGLEV